MAKQIVGLGTAPNDGTGDTLRAGGDKINDNFNEVYTALGDGTTLSPEILKADTPDQLTAGFSAAIHDLGTPAAASTVTLNDADGNYQKLTNANNFTLAPPAMAANEATSIVVHVTNGAGTQGVITFAAGFETPSGDTVPTAASAVFFLHITASHNGTSQKSTVNVVAMA